jgi:hypothetical protein
MLNDFNNSSNRDFMEHLWQNLGLNGRLREVVDLWPNFIVTRKS